MYGLTGWFSGAMAAKIRAAAPVIAQRDTPLRRGSSNRDAGQTLMIAGFGVPDFGWRLGRQAQAGPAPTPDPAG